MSERETPGPELFGFLNVDLEESIGGLLDMVGNDLCDTGHPYGWIALERISCHRKWQTHSFPTRAA